MWSQQTATDFSNYAWFNGAWRGDAANVAHGKDGRLYLGVKGRDRTTKVPSYVSIEMPPEALAALRDAITSKLAEAETTALTAEITQNTA